MYCSVNVHCVKSIACEKENKKIQNDTFLNFTTLENVPHMYYICDTYVIHVLCFWCITCVEHICNTCVEHIMYMFYICNTCVLPYTFIACVELHM